MIYEGISFNDEWAASKKLEDFIKHELHHGLSRDQLKELHTICKAKHSRNSNSSGGSKPIKEEAE